MAETLAEEFIDRIREMTEYNVNVMNDKGIIIASKNLNRIGDFHEIAYQIVRGNAPFIEVDSETCKKYVGVQPGIMFPVVVHGERIGSVGVTGEPDEVRDIGKVLHFAIETMYIYEEQNRKRVQSNSIRDRFVYNVIYDRQPDVQNLREDAELMNWDEGIPRIAIYIIKDSFADAITVRRKLRENPYYSSQDIISIVRDKDIVVFKSFPRNAQFADYKSVVREFVDDAVAYLKFLNAKYQISVGTFQDDFGDYGTSFQHCLWIQNNMPGELVFFYDHVNEYMMSRIRADEFRKIYRVYSSCLNEEEKENFIRVIGTLQNENYNLVSSSNKLYIHKNTLRYHYNKIREKLGIDPIQNCMDRAFLSYLLYYEINYSSESPKKS